MARQWQRPVTSISLPLAFMTVPPECLQGGMLAFSPVNPGGAAMASIRFLISLGRSLACAGVFALTSAAALAHDDAKAFIASWSIGHINPLAANVAHYNNQTLREVVRISAGGEFVRVRIANTFGTDTLVIGEARIALSASAAAIVPGSSRVLTFSGQRSVNVTAGAPVLSDPVRL